VTSKVPRLSKYAVMKYISHEDLYVRAEHCPECGVVPLHWGHDCSRQGGSAFPCPRCLAARPFKERPEYLEERCPDCPLCPDCCDYLTSSWDEACMAADGLLRYGGADEHDIKYVKSLRSRMQAAKTPEEHYRLKQTLIDFIFAESLLGPPQNNVTLAKNSALKEALQSPQKLEREN